eukprot:284816003_4
MFFFRGKALLSMLKFLPTKLPVRLLLTSLFFSGMYRHAHSRGVLLRRGTSSTLPFICAQTVLGYGRLRSNCVRIRHFHAIYPEVGHAQSLAGKIHSGSNSVALSFSPILAFVHRPPLCRSMGRASSSVTLFIFLFTLLCFIPESRPVRPGVDDDFSISHDRGFGHRIHNCFEFRHFRAQARGIAVRKIPGMNLFPSHALSQEFHDKLDIGENVLKDIFFVMTKKTHIISLANPAHVEQMLRNLNVAIQLLTIFTADSHMSALPSCYH